MTKRDLEQRHLADLHRLAADAGIEGYRMLPRKDLVGRILDSGAVPDGDRDGGSGSEEPAGTVEGRLQVTRRGHGFVIPDEGGDDIYVSASQIRRCELSDGDRMSGPWRQPRRGERHRALVRVDSVNGEPLVADPDLPDFDALTPVAPTRRIELEPASEDLGVRALELLVPLAYGHRSLVLSPRGGGRTTLLRRVAACAGSSDRAPDPLVLLVDERPEEVTAWREAAPDTEIEAATAEMTPDEQVRIAERALGRAKRRVQRGDDVLLIIDSISRLALAYGDAARVKPFFGAGRETAEEGAGSLTVLAAVLLSAGAEPADAAYGVLATTESSVLRLDADLVEAGIAPPVVSEASMLSGEDALRSPEELAAVRKLREELVALPSREAAERLCALLAETSSNEELLERL